MKKGYPKLSDLFLAVSVLMLVMILYLINTNVQAEKQKRLILPNVGKGKTIDYFDLSNSSRERTDSSVLFDTKWTAVFIFKRPCASCDYNTNYWKKISKSFKKYGVKFYGIILEDFDDSFQALVDRKIGIEYYFPLDIEKFKKAFNVKFKLSQTVILKKDKVIFSKAGDLNADDYFSIKKKIKGE